MAEIVGATEKFWYKTRISGEIKSLYVLITKFGWEAPPAWWLLHLYISCRSGFMFLWSETQNLCWTETKYLGWTNIGPDQRMIKPGFVHHVHIGNHLMVFENNRQLSARSASCQPTPPWGHIKTWGSKIIAQKQWKMISIKKTFRHRKVYTIRKWDFNV